MKSFGLFILVLGLGFSSFAFADGECSNAQLLKAIQAKCGHVQLNGKPGYYQGEVSDTYEVPVKVRAHAKYMRVIIGDGGLACTGDNVEVQSTCP